MLPEAVVARNHCGDRLTHTSTGHYDVCVWTFAKGADELTVEQWTDGEAVIVTLTRADETGTETRQAYEFPDERAAEEFHTNFEPTLLKFGWSFVGYLPERRTHDDRRQRVRPSERRRWWTDGVLLLE